MAFSLFVAFQQCSTEAVSAHALNVKIVLIKVEVSLLLSSSAVLRL